MKIFANTVLITFFLVCQHFQAWSTDTFPLDLWEEMTTWERNRMESHISGAEDYSEADSTHIKSVAPLSFPFDVQKELDDLDGTDWKRPDLNRYRHQTTAALKENVYWLP